MDTERSWVMRGTPLISISIGLETMRSTSSGARPGYWVTICTCTS